MATESYNKELAYFQVIKVVKKVWVTFDANYHAERRAPKVNIEMQYEYSTKHSVTEPSESMHLSLKHATIMPNHEVCDLI